MKDYFGQEVKVGDWVYVSYSSRGVQGTHQLIKDIQNDKALCHVPKEYLKYTPHSRWRISDEFVKAPDGWTPSNVT